MQQYYVSSARELSWLVGVCKAPVLQHFAETILGSSTIRNFDQESRFRDTNMKLIDGYSRPKFHTAGAMEWLVLRLDMLSSISFAFSLAFLTSISKGVIDPVERIYQYTCIPSESPLAIEANWPNHSWPKHGEIDIRDLQVRYAHTYPLCFEALCIFRGGMKTGIVGRTGSGKPTLIQALFRMVEPAFGQILIDGINISLIGLHDLRPRLTVIPQGPVMFEGTVCSNLDPLEEYTDEQIWEALDKCQLGNEVRKKEEKLDSREAAGLFWACVKKSKILMLDEATASVDTATDNLIQQTLRQHFSDCTVITIAHRITSVLDSDMVLLLNHGFIEEYDSPAKSSSFWQLVAE
ncbi:ABC transporter C family member 3 [Melia azedarach]|uniref:ABC transporter C family member 3 n=1 Tax=Melia azedarach TaxID=155640 RepID=A0ACC1YN98_MELAZ|nr:ABC transporter C family member 3 [Melia azedarach]